jgi:hypothetical protein
MTLTLERGQEDAALVAEGLVEVVSTGRSVPLLVGRTT